MGGDKGLTGGYRSRVNSVGVVKGRGRLVVSPFGGVDGLRHCLMTLRSEGFNNVVEISFCALGAEFISVHPV